MAETTPPVHRSGTFAIGADLPVHRLGFGAMRLTGPGIWGPPRDPDTCIAVLRRAVELGVDFVDTADSYGPEVSEDLIRRALHPYPESLVIATKAGLTRSGPDTWAPVGRPEYLRQQCELSLRRLGLERIDLFQLHRIDPKVPADEQFGLLAELQAEGKIRHAGLSQVQVPDIVAAREHVTVATVQNLYNVENRVSDDVLRYCEAHAIGFIPWFPFGGGELLAGDDRLAGLVGGGVTTGQAALAWLLRRSPVMLPIPGTSSVEHLEENCAAAGIELTDEQFAAMAGD